MAYINDLAFDACLSYIDTGANRLDICSTEPTTYAQATSTYTLGNTFTLAAFDIGVTDAVAV